MGRIVFICTANRARSPFAAALLRRELREVRVAVESYGILEQMGAPALPGAVRAAEAYGVDLAPHRARALHVGALDGVQLALGFEPAHLAAAVGAGAARERSFLLGELAHVLEFDALPWPAGADGLDERVAHANARRFAAAAVPRTVADPVGRSDRVFLQTYSEIDRMVTILGARLFGTNVDSSAA